MTPTCIVLAGGLGTRLRSAVPYLPKCLAPISGQPFISWQLRSLANRGVGRFVLALGYGADRVVESLALPWARDLKIEYVLEPDALGTGGATRFAMSELGIDEALIANGDTFLGGSLMAMLEPLDLSGGELMRMATVQVPDRTRFGGVEVNASHRVLAFLEKGHVGPGLINAGLYRIHRHALDSAHLGAYSLESKVMPTLVSKSELTAREASGPFIDIGVPDDYYLFDAGVHDYVRQA